MEGLRGFAVLLVFLVHYYSLFGEYLPSGSWVDRLCWIVSNAGNAGVDLFFLLSGYLIYGNLLRKPLPYPVFLAKRARRIYPTFFAVFIVYLVLARIYPIPELRAGLFASSAYVAANALFLPGMLPIKPLITVAWSLSYEVLFYLTIPLIITIGGLARYGRHMRLSLFIGTVAVSISLAPFSGAAHIRLLMFLGGMILYEIYEAQPPKDTLSRRGECVTMGGFILTVVLSAVLQADQGSIVLVHVPQVEREVSRQLLLLTSMVALCIYALQFDGILKAVFSWPPLRWLGTISYSYYLIHGISIHGFRILIASIAPPSYGEKVFWAALPFALASSLVAALILFRLVERPYSLQPAAASRQRREISQQEGEKST